MDDWPIFLTAIRMLWIQKRTLTLWILGSISSSIKARTYKDFPFKDNSLIFLSLGIKILSKILNSVKLINSNLTHYLVKLWKDVNLLVFCIISFFFSKAIKRFCSIIELLFSTKGLFFLVADSFISMA